MASMADNLPQKLQLKFDLTNDKYLDFIGEMRDKARDKDESSHGRPILPSESDADPPYIVVNLQEDGLGKGFAKIRRYDLRLINYQDPFGNFIAVDEYEIYDIDSRLVDFGIEGFMLGLPTFIDAVKSLLNSCKRLNYNEENFDVGTSFLVMCDQKKPNNSQEKLNVRTSLAVLCLVLCEATKLDLLSCTLDNAFKSRFEVPLSSWLLDRINDWRLFSEELLAVDQHEDTAECNSYIPSDINDWHDGRRVIGVTYQDVALCLGILLAVPLPPDPMVEERPPGSKLVEIFSVSVFFNGGRSGSVYGTVKIDDRCGKFHIYDRQRTQSESIQSHGTLSLQDPGGIITAYDDIIMYLDLLEDGGDNLEISKGTIYWDNSRNYFDRYDNRISSMVRGKNGYAIVYYSVFFEAYQAEVEATLVRKDGQSDTSQVCVCGRLSARYGSGAYATDSHLKYYQTPLFDKPVSKELFALPCTLESCGRGERVMLGETIKLSRSRVAVPVDFTLELVADMKSCGGKPIVTGSMNWALPREFGVFEDFMVGHPGDTHLLQVKVKWIQVPDIDIESE